MSASRRALMARLSAAATWLAAFLWLTVVIPAPPSFALVLASLVTGAVFCGLRAVTPDGRP